ncbi:FG-GAP-like repeat-containing protein [Pedococcus sp. NPDC057267]|uniref:FG-GAP-like repeat-containing protein n=1 Tax=Pedococcus sp. NPDC057267 TaxID=3346077 RepID=UPI0036433ED0
MTDTSRQISMGKGSTRSRARRCCSFLGGVALALAALPAVVVSAPAAQAQTQAPARPAPVKPHVQHVSLQGVPVAQPLREQRQVLDQGQKDPVATAHAAAVTPEQPLAGPVAVVGVSWPRGAVGRTESFQVRTLTAGAWTPWQALDSSDIGADPGSSEARGRPAVDGTDPYVVTGATRVQVRALTSRQAVPAQASVSVIDPGTSSAPAAPAAGPGQGPSAAPATLRTTVPGSVDTAPAVLQSPAPAAVETTALAARPQIYSRADWGADESIRKGTPDYGQVQMAFVHHTDGSNNYQPGDVPAIIRGIYAYHVLTEGWNDIGYNFLVDRFGRIWEGRYGGVDKAVIGAQTLNYNTWSTGVAAIGTFTTAAPPAALLTGIEQVLAWKFSVHGIPATGSVWVRDKYFNRISGHRDGFATTCPGQMLYDQLPTIRSVVKSLIGTQVASPLTRRGQVLAYPGTSVPPTLSGAPALLRLASPTPVRDGQVVGNGWNGLRNITVTPDLSGDGAPDVLAVDPGTGRLRLYRGNGRGGFLGMTASGSGWQNMTRLIPAGDWDGDGHNDLLAVNSAGQLVLYSGDGAGWFRGATVVGTGWNVMSSVFLAGDVDHDGTADLGAVRASDGALLLYPHLRDGSWGDAQRWGGGWGSFTALNGGIDLDADGNQGDLLARDASGRMRTYYADAGGQLTRSNVWGSGWAGLTNLSSGVDFDGDGTSDLLAVSPSASAGALVLYAGTAARDFNAPASDPGISVPGANWVRVVGDVDGDGYPDAVARTDAGALLAMKGSASGRFGQPFTIGSDWQAFDLVEPAGDLNNDGVPDLVARTPAGELYIYPMTASFGFLPRYDSGGGWQAMSSLAGVGSFNDDTNHDVVALRPSDGALLLFRGGGPGTLVESTVMASGQNDLAQVLGVGDVNGDGVNDVVARDRGGRLWLYAGAGSGRLQAGRQPISAPVVQVIG